MLDRPEWGRTFVSNSNKTLLVLSQVYVPDPASVGQHMADVAAAMARRGYLVTVLAGNCGYDNPSIKYPTKETIDGVDVHRLPLSWFGKTSVFMRLVGSASFLVQCIVRGILTPRLGGILVSTSPPMCAAAALIISVVRRTPFTYWIMDINPDQMVAMGWIKASSPLVRIFHWFNRHVLHRAAHAITLDRFMANRVLRKLDIRDKLTIMPPWPHDKYLQTVDHEDNPFRHKHQLSGKFVVMYSGNHSICTPLRTILRAALNLQDEDQLVFLFVGDGTGKGEVDELIEMKRPRNICSLPYQPLSQIKYSLSAADVHLVVVGDTEVGVRHPCKIYGALALQRPILLLGPDPCHASDLVRQNRLGWHIQHDDVDGAVRTIRQILQTNRSVLQEMGHRGQRLVRKQISQNILCPEFCDFVERTLQGAGKTQHRHQR